MRKLLWALLVMLAIWQAPAMGFDTRANGGAHSDGMRGSASLTSEQYISLTGAKDFADTSFGGKIRHGKNGEVHEGDQLNYSGPSWPAVIPSQSTGKLSDFERASIERNFNAIGGSGNPANTVMATGSQMAALMAESAVTAADLMQQPERNVPAAREALNQENQHNADTCGAMARNMAGCAIDTVRSFIPNFTVDGTNKWNRLRNELFLPIAILLLLPGAILCQVKATVGQGFGIFGEISPIEGIMRSIIAVFLIPASYLIVNYGIDLSNSIGFTIAMQYKKTFGGDMYREAMCAEIRAMPVRDALRESDGFTPSLPANMLKAVPKLGKSARALWESQNVDVELYDPCAGLNETPEDRSNERVPYFVNAQRANLNGLNSMLATTWNILCAFQVCYLYYLWFVGPIVAALWVYPMKQLRDAFPSWCEGVITLCFWSLFWNTAILLMACCRGMDDTGTVITTALNFLATASVKYAFDFGGLVKAAGQEVAKEAEKAAKGEGGGSGSGGGEDSNGQPQPAPNNAPNPAPAPPDSGINHPCADSLASVASAAQTNAGADSDDAALADQSGAASIPRYASSPENHSNSQSIGSHYVTARSVQTAQSSTQEFANGMTAPPAISFAPRAGEIGNAHIAHNEFSTSTNSVQPTNHMNQTNSNYEVAFSTSNINSASTNGFSLDRTAGHSSMSDSGNRSESSFQNSHLQHSSALPVSQAIGACFGGGVSNASDEVIRPEPDETSSRTEAEALLQRFSQSSLAVDGSVNAGPPPASNSSHSSGPTRTSFERASTDENINPSSLTQGPAAADMERTGATGQLQQTFSSTSGASMHTTQSNFGGNISSYPRESVDVTMPSYSAPSTTPAPSTIPAPSAIPAPVMISPSVPASSQTLESSNTTAGYNPAPDSHLRSAVDSVPQAVEPVNAVRATVRSADDVQNIAPTVTVNTAAFGTEQIQPVAVEHSQLSMLRQTVLLRAVESANKTSADVTQDRTVPLPAPDQHKITEPLQETVRQGTLRNCLSKKPPEGRNRLNMNNPWYLKRQESIRK